jgi:hypothetical protein
MAYGGHVLDMSFKAAGVEVDSMSSISVYFNGTR